MISSNFDQMKSSELLFQPQLTVHKLALAKLFRADQHCDQTMIPI